MLKKLSSEEFDRLKNDSHRILFYEEIEMGNSTPLQVYHSYEKTSHSALFEVIDEEGDQKKSYSYLGFHPLAIFKSKNQVTEISYKGHKEHLKGHPYAELRRLIKRFSPSPQSQHPPYSDCLIGFVSYDAIRLIENLPDKLPDLDEVPDLYFVFYETVFIFNHSTQTLCIVISMENTIDYQTACDKLDAVKQKIKTEIFNFTLPTKEANLPIQVEIEDDAYCKSVLLVQDYIRKGHIFQMVLSRSFSTPVKATPFQIYLVLSRINPSPYMFLLNGGDFAIVGASPEKLVSVKNGYLETVPVGGTHPKELNKSDTELSQELLADSKEVAEHIMKMEVGRNDLSSVSKPGSVKILELAGTRVFSHVVHIITKIGGTLRQDCDTLDVIQAMLPAAPISGSPKRRALELIDEFEKSRRGFYGGAICLMDTKGNLISCITIRTILVKNGVAKVRAGATIVAYSSPSYESDESRHKAEAPLKALKLIEGSLE